MVTLVTSTCAETTSHTIISHEGDRLTILYCPDGSHNMAASTSKTILHTTGKDGAKVRQWPTAVFNDTKGAKAYAGFLRLAYKSGTADAVKALDPGVRLRENGDLLTEVKFSVLTVPYAPTPAMIEGEEIGETPTA